MNNICPSSTWFGRITFFLGIVLVMTASSQFWLVIGYLSIASAFIYSIFFTDKSCTVDYEKEENDTEDEVSEAKASEEGAV